MVPPVATRHRRRGTAVRLLAAVAVALSLATGLLSPVRVDTDPAPPASAAPTRARAVPLVAAPPHHEVSAGRTRAVERLLAERSSALLRRDRVAFLATVDPGAPALRTRQAALFDALAQVPLGSWSYDLDPAVRSQPDSRLDRRYGKGRWWAPGVALRYALEGFDVRPVVVDQYLTFVLRDDRWLLAADDDFALQGRPTPRALWDRGPVVAVRTERVLVLGRPGSEAQLREVASLTAAAVPRVTRVWGPWPERVAVLVPASAQEMSGLLGGRSDLSQIAAVATAELRGGADDYDPAGDRVLVNPDTFFRLGRLGRRVVLTHEVTHVATRPASGPAVPTWLAEGFADYVGYRDVALPVAVSARELAREVRAGRLPRALPADEDFDGSSPRLTQTYEASWLAVRHIAQRHGQPALLRLYRAVGSRRRTPAPQALEQALREELGTTTAGLTAEWRTALQRQLG